MTLKRYHVFRNYFQTLDLCKRLARLSYKTVLHFRIIISLLDLHTPNSTVTFCLCLSPIGMIPREFDLLKTAQN